MGVDLLALRQIFQQLLFCDFDVNWGCSQLSSKCNITIDNNSALQLDWKDSKMMSGFSSLCWSRWLEDHETSSRNHSFYPKQRFSTDNLTTGSCKNLAIRNFIVASVDLLPTWEKLFKISRTFKFVPHPKGQITLLVYTKKDFFHHPTYLSLQVALQICV